MADRLTELQDAINLQAENLGNAVGVIQQLAQPSLFRELNHNGRREKEWASNPEFQALLQNQSQEDNAHKFAVTIATTAKQIELLINSLPAEEASLELQDEVTRHLLSEYRKESAKLVHLITKSFQTRLSKVRQLLSKIAEVQLLTRTLENEVSCTPCLDMINTISGRCTTTFTMQRPEMSILMTTEADVLSVWMHYLSLCLAAIIICRFVGILLPILVPKLAAHLLPSCRAHYRASQLRCQEVRDLRKKMSQLNMVDNFAVYSKLERKVRALDRQQAESDRSQLGTTLVCGLFAQCLRYLLHAVLLAWLVYGAPRERLSDERLALLYETRALVGSLVHWTHYIPNWAISMLWIPLCEATASLLLSKFQRCIEGEEADVEVVPAGE
ncbi:Mediator of RNA polymerase II transcription subunit [Echinococcus granulosus]|uniref:Mediator of RNA polymerase II transcription subunit 21 n=2 Tax=Echinococcus granulosus TaxID=6210 RepID=W6UIH1_ECHGR|nr:Mediator of RNA polymerase II transcription subunit [Echinococcus granulosus]EUB57897.1 Mediator of RNA polymerase II transcription subunit [Echinococcus granulosus]